MTLPTNLPQGKVTLLFTDLEDSTPANAALGDVLYMTRLRNPHLAILRDCLREHKGWESGTPAGDSILAVFHTPDAGLACAKAMQERLQNAPIEVEHEGITWRAKVRIGVHTAERQMQPDEHGHYNGEDINKASRVMSQGKGGQILISPTSHNEAGSRQMYTFHAWDNRMLNGYAQPVSLYEMLWYDGQKPQEPGRRWIPDWTRKYADAYIEREQPMQEIFKWLDGDTPMLIVHGPGGMGKTRLCVQAILRMVGRFEGRVYGVALDKEFGANAEAVTPELLAAAIARCVKAPEEVQQNPLKALKPYLEKQGEILLFLDNAESVFNDKTLQWLGEIVPPLWKVRWIVSSRHDPGLPDIALPYALERLETPQSEADLFDNPCHTLFKARIEERRPVQDISDIASLARVLRLTGGFPLAIELVAAQRKFATLSEMAEGLNSSLLDWQAMRHKAGQRRGEDNRHESMEACIHWSVQMLPQEEQAAYACLHIWEYDFDARAAQSIADIPQAYLDHWQTMSLLERLEVGSVTRYRLLPVFQEYARRLAGALAIDRNPLQQRYVDYYAPLALANRNINDPAQKALLDREWRSMAAAAEVTDDAETLLQLSNGLHTFFFLSIYSAEGAQLHERARRAAYAAGNEQGEAECIRCLGEIALARSEYEQARHKFELALPLFQYLGNVKGEVNCIMSLGHIALRRSDHEAAQQKFEQALLKCRQAGDVQGEANCIRSLGEMQFRRSDYEGAKQTFEQILPLFQQGGDVRGEASCIFNFGEIALERSDQEQARLCYEQALSLYRQIGSVLGEANCIWRLGDMALRRSEHEAAQQQFEQVLPLYRQVGDVQGEANCIRILGEIALRHFDNEVAREKFEQSLRLYERIPEPYSIGWTRVRLARIAPNTAERSRHVEAARTAWTQIKRDDLIRRLEVEFG